MRELIFGPMPEGATPQTHLPAGPWCFSGREQLFPGWDSAEQESLGFFFPADPFAGGADMEAYARSANGEIIRLIGVLGEHLNEQRGSSYSPVFWETALTPWLILFVHMLGERQKRVLDLIARYGKEPLRVPLLLQDTPFSFQNSLEFMQHGVLDVDFNHFLFSRIIEAVAPAGWELYFVPERSLHQSGVRPAPVTPLACVEPKATQGEAPQSRKGCGYMSEEDRQSIRASFADKPNRPAKGLRERVKDRLRTWLRDLPFPRNKGFSLAEALFLSLIVRRLGTGKRLKEDQPGACSVTDHTLPLELYAGPPLTWVFPVEKLLHACLPKDILESPLPSVPVVTGRLRGMTAAVSQDDVYRLQLAAWREGGGRLFSTQHGANYGNLRSVGGMFFEYRQHAFFTWGWETHQDYPCNCVPLPHPLPSRIRDAHAAKEDSLILVGTEMSPLLYRLKSRPQAGDLPEYRRDKLRFLSALPPEMQGKSLYRPYPPSPSSLEDGPYVQRAMPGLDLCRGDLTARMLACRLLVLDHYGTTLHMALAANVPTLCFWNREQWGMEEGTGEHLDRLAQAGILHTDPLEAAVQAACVWPDVHTWWSSPPVQDARLDWLEHYARCLPTRAAGGWSTPLMRAWREGLGAVSK